MKALTAKNLKQSLWETLGKLETSTISPGEADAIAVQAREILRTTNVQLRVAAQAKRSIAIGVIEFAEK